MQSVGRVLSCMVFLLIFANSTLSFAAPKAELWSRWQENAEQSTTRIVHTAWGQFLSKYLLISESGSANLLRYAAVSADDKRALDQYIAELAVAPLPKLNRVEQKALWINLYNALTVRTILDHYPVKSIRDIRSGWFNPGPWDLKLVKVAGVEISLNDIEHRILRPIWLDNRVHYAVNCASLGCPNLQIEPFTAANMDRLLDKAAHDYVNSPRGVDLASGKLTLSSIYDWFPIDFGNSETSLLAHLEQFADPALAAKLKSYQGSISYQYSWDLNQE
ncbi:MAG: DUF547 domain-containing protein [Desulfobacterales bacterium]|nr:DUF547 domain-containing protein [Desulfobacterales bacterium]